MLEEQSRDKDTNWGAVYGWPLWAQLWYHGTLSDKYSGTGAALGGHCSALGWCTCLTHIWEHGKGPMCSEEVHLTESISWPEAGWLLTAQSKGTAFQKVQNEVEASPFPAVFSLSHVTSWNRNFGQIQVLRAAWEQFSRTENLCLCSVTLLIWSKFAVLVTAKEKKVPSRSADKSLHWIAFLKHQQWHMWRVMWHLSRFWITQDAFCKWETNVTHVLAPEVSQSKAVLAAAVWLLCYPLVYQRNYILGLLLRFHFTIWEALTGYDYLLISMTQNAASGLDYFQGLCMCSVKDVELSLDHYQL